MVATRASGSSDYPGGDATALSALYERQEWRATSDGFDHFLGVDLRRHSQVMLKTVAETSPFAQQRTADLEHEFRVLSLLAHPSVVRALDFDRDELQRCYLVLDLGSGYQSTADLNLRALSDRDVASIMEDLLLALEYCHGRGIVHDNVVPDSMLLRPPDDGEPWKARLAGFHRSRHSAATGLQSHPLGVHRFFLYPGAHAHDTRRSDVYGVGALATWLLAGAEERSENAGSTPLRLLEAIRGQHDSRLAALLHDAVSTDDAHGST